MSAVPIRATTTYNTSSGWAASVKRGKVPIWGREYVHRHNRLMQSQAILLAPSYELNHSPRYQERWGALKPYAGGWRRKRVPRPPMPFGGIVWTVKSPIQVLRQRIRIKRTRDWPSRCFPIGPMPWQFCLFQLFFPQWAVGMSGMASSNTSTSPTRCKRNQLIF